MLTTSIRGHVCRWGVAVALGLAATHLQAADVFTDPVGFVNLAAQSNADTYFSMPFTRQDEGRGAVASVSGSVITVGGTPWLTDQWVFPATSAADGTVSNTYYVVLTSGAKQGAYYTITNNTENTLDVELSPEDLSGIASNDTFRIIPYWTLNTIWPNGKGVVPSPGTSGGARRTIVLFPNIDGVGINLASIATYYFLQTATATNWQKSTGGNYNHQIILPDQYVIVRQLASATTTTNTVVGTVPTFNWRIPLYGTNVPQDNFIGLPRPTVQTLNDLGFTNNNNGNGFLVSPGTSGGARRDILLVVNNTSMGINKATIGSYYLLSTGWRKSTDSSTDVGTNVVFQPGSAFIIRKYPTNTQTVIWSQPPNYTNE